MKYVCVYVRYFACFVCVCVCAACIQPNTHAKRRIAHERGVSTRSVCTPEVWQLGAAMKRGGGQRSLINIKTLPQGRAGVCVCVCMNEHTRISLHECTACVHVCMLCMHACLLPTQKRLTQLMTDTFCVCMFVLCVCYIGVNTRATLTNYVKDVCKPGSLVVTDCAPGFHTGTLNANGYVHMTNDHAQHQFSIQGVQTLDGTNVSSNAMESQWAGENAGKRKWEVTSANTTEKTDKYAQIYMFRRNFNCNSATDSRQLLPLRMYTRAIAELMHDAHPEGWAEGVTL